MPNRALRPCLDCGTPSDQRRCPQHRKADYERKTYPWSYIYYTTEWRRARQAILERDPICTLCRLRPSQIADHITPLQELYTLLGWRLSPYDTKNLRGICRPCNGNLTPWGRR